MTTETTTNPRELARQEGLRGHPNERARMRSLIASTFGIRVDDSGRLQPTENAELLALHKKATKHEDWETGGAAHYGLTKLSKDELGRWRTLVSKAAGKPGLLDAIDEDGRIAARIRELVGRAERTERPLVEEPGSVRLPAFVFGWLRAPDPVLLAEHVAVLVVVLASLENGQSVFAGGCYVEGDGDDRVLVLRSGIALGRLDPEGVISSHFSQTLKHLAANELLTLVEQGGERRVGYGRRILESSARVGDEHAA